MLVHRRYEEESLMFRTPSLQITHPGFPFQIPQASTQPNIQSSCAFLSDEKYKSVIRRTLEDEVYLINGFFDFNEASLTASSSVVWRIDLPLMNQDILLAYAIAKGFWSEERDQKIYPHDFIMICQFIQSLPPEHKSFDFIFMQCPFFQSLKERELAIFNERQREVKQRHDQDYNHAMGVVSFNLLTFLCFFPRVTLESEGGESYHFDVLEYTKILEELWAVAMSSDKNMSDSDLLKCERLFQLRALHLSDPLNIFETLKESYAAANSMEKDLLPRYYVPFESQKEAASVAYLEVVAELSTPLSCPARLVEQHQPRAALESSDDLTLTMSFELPVSQELLDKQLAMKLSDEEHQKEADTLEQLQKDEEVARALQQEFDQEPPIDNMRLFRPLINVIKSVFFKEPEDISLLKTYSDGKLSAFIDSVLSDKSYLEDQEGDVLNIKAYEASLLQLKSYYSAAAFVPEILGHLTKAQVMTIFRLSESNRSAEYKMRKLFGEWNQGDQKLPDFLREILHSIDGYIVYEKDADLANVIAELFNVLSFSHVKNLPNVVAERDKSHSVLYYLIRIAALQSIFE